MSSRKQKERRKAARQAAESLVVNGQEFVDRRDYMPTGFGFGGGMFGIGMNLQTSLNDRKDGRNAPFVENEYDANTIRGFARFITTINCPGIGIVENLKNYIIGRGIKSSVTAKKGRQVPDGLVECCQDVIDEFNEDNKIIGNFDRESLLRDRRDGECYIGLYPKKGKTHLRTIEPDSVRDPGAAPFTEEFLNEHFGLQIEYATRWNWGHHTDEHDIENCHGLCIQWATAEPYDYLPRKYWHHSKAENVDRCVLRGMSDFYPAWKWLKQQERLLTNTGEGAAELAAISYITQFVNATQEQVRSMRASQADYEITRMGASGGSNTIYKHKREPGVLNVPSGQEYLPGPMGAERGQSFLQVVQGILRQVGTRWCMTEGMISGDDSNNNMASSVEAGGRFWKYADASQGRECAKWQEIHTRVLQNAFEMGRFERFGITWEEMRRSLVVTVTCPEIDVRDPKVLADTRAIEKANGVLSAKTWADEAGYDHDKEVAQGAKDEGGMGGPGCPGGGFPGHGGPGGPGGGPGGLPGAPPAPQQRQPGEWEDKSRMQWKRNVKAISDVVSALQAQSISAMQAKVQLGMLGMNPDRIDSLLADVEDDGQMNDPKNVQDLAESFAWHCSSRWRMIREASPPFSTVAESGNPNHDPSNGQFASGGGSSGGGASSSKKPAAKGRSKEQVDAIKEYTDESNPLNEPLRDGGPESLTGRPKEMFKHLQPLAKEPLPEPVTVYRGVQLPGDIEDSLKPGHEVSFPGMSSSSHDLEEAKVFGRRGVMLKIRAKTGIVVGGDAADLSSGQKELIQAHGTKYKVVGDVEHSLAGHRRMIELEEVDPPKAAASEPKESGSRKDLKTKYPRWTGEKVDGREVIRKVDNLSSIEASVSKPDIMPGIRVIDTKHFETFGNGKIDYYAADDHERVKKLAEGMKASGKIKPLIVVVDDKGPYILEGGHRYEALKLLGAKSFPAKVVIAREDLPRPAARASGGPKFTKKPEDAPQVPPTSGRAKRTETREFKKWFGDSKVVDSAGKPLVVYHGTADDFEVFAHGQAGRDNTSDSKLAHFFSSNPDVADEWTWKKGDQTGSIKPVFLKMENPLVVKGTKYYDPKHHLDSVKKAIADGHDGVIFKGQGSLTGASDHYAVINPRNIKSASGNQGTYNPKSGHIGESRAIEVGNPNHAPAGSPQGGEFTSGDGGSSGPAPKATKGRAARTATRKAKGADHPAVDTASPKFKEWFGGSKIVDEAGKPQVMYHGTDANFTEFDVGKAGSRDPGDYGRGLYFTHSEANAGMYAEWKKGGGQTAKSKQRIMPVYLKIEKPFHADEPLTHELATRIVEDANVSRKAKGKEPLKNIQEHAARLLKDYNGAEEAWTKSRSKVRAGILQNYINSDGLARLGFDGVIGKAEVVAFHPHQVKSAAGNTGAFDPKSHNIHESRLLGTGLDPFIDYP